MLLRRNPRAEPLPTRKQPSATDFQAPLPPFALKLAQTLRSRSARARLQGHGPAGSSRSAFALASPNLEGEPGGETPAPGIAPPRGVSVRRIQSRTDRLSFGLSSSAPPWGDRRAPAFGLSPPTPCTPRKGSLSRGDRRDFSRRKSGSTCSLATRARGVGSMAGGGRCARCWRPRMKGGFRPRGRLEAEHGVS